MAPAERAGAVRTALDGQLGPIAWAEGEAADPATLTAPAGADEAGLRRTWAAAHWAVASADEYGVVRVQVGDRVWDRTSPEEGWTPLEDAAPDAGLSISVVPAEG